MRKTLFMVLAVLLCTACADSEKQLKKRANELCQYIPDHELLEKSRDYMTTDFYAVLDTMFYRLPEHEAMDHEWLYFFVTGNGGAIADYEVVAVEKTDATHAVATILVRQVWPEGITGDNENEPEEHRLYMERVNGEWLMSDFDEHKADCIRYIANNRKEQALRNAISEYLVRETAPLYLKGDLCVPVLMIIAEEELDSIHTVIWGDYRIFWYVYSGDTLKTYPTNTRPTNLQGGLWFTYNGDTIWAHSGTYHSGRMTLCKRGDKFLIMDFEQILEGYDKLSSAKRIFGSHYDVYQNMHSNADVGESVRREQLQEYVRRHNIPVRYYQDYGQPAVEL